MLSRLFGCLRGRQRYRYEEPPDEASDEQQGDEKVAHEPLAVEMDMNTKKDDELMEANEKGHSALDRRKLPYKDGDLSWACKEGDVAAVQELLEAGVDVNAENGYIGTPLLLASREGHAEVVRELLAAGADVNRGHIRTPLHWASGQGHVEVVQQLLAAGADGGAKDRDGHTPLLMAVDWAEEGRQLAVVQQLLAADVSTKDKVNALSRALRRKKLGCAGLLLESLGHVDINDGSTQCQVAVCIRELDSLPDQDLVTRLHHNMTDELKSANMRLLNLEEVLQWDRLYVYEDVPVSAFIIIPYSDTDDELWSKTAVLSWRWARSKPGNQQPGFSPMSDEQFLELKCMLRSVQAVPGLTYVWIDWCCAPQYSGDTMVEVLRSKVYYMRAQQMLVLPAYDQLPKDHRVVKALKGIQQLLCQNFGHTTNNGIASSLLLSTVNSLLEERKLMRTPCVSQSHVSIANHEYYRRIWTLAERMARHGGNEQLCNCMSLQTWVGMVLHAVNSWSPEVGTAVCFQNSLGSLEVWAQAFTEVQSQHAFKVLLGLLLGAVAIWYQKRPSDMDAAPSKAWLQSYLADARKGVYQAWDVADKVWGVYSYYSAAMCSRSLADLLGALRELVQLATGFPPVCLSQVGIDDISTNQLAALPMQELLVLAAVDLKAAVNKTDALWFAVQHGFAEGVRLLANAGADVKNATLLDCVDCIGHEEDCTPLHLASDLGHVAVVQQLLAAGAAVQAKMQRGCTPLFWASRKGHVAVVQQLLAAGADVGVRNAACGETPLHWAILLGDNVEVAQLLLAAGADVSVKDQEGKTPLMHAEERGCTAVVELLKGHMALSTRPQ